MKRRVILDLLVAARVLLEETEADIRRQDGVLIDLTDQAERSERMQLILGLQQKRLRRAPTVQRLLDELESPDNGE
jgi:hypothetical protein